MGYWKDPDEVREYIEMLEQTLEAVENSPVGEDSHRVELEEYSVTLRTEIWEGYE